MALHRVVVHFHTGSDLEAVHKLVEDEGGRNLPSPLIFPPLLLANVKAETIPKIRELKDVKDVADQGPLDEE